MSHAGGRILFIASQPDALRWPHAAWRMHVTLHETRQYSTRCYPPHVNQCGIDI